MNLSHFFFEKSLALVEIMFFKLKLFKNLQVKHWVQFRVVSQLVNQQRTTLVISLFMRAYMYAPFKVIFQYCCFLYLILSVSITLQWKVIVNVVLHHARFQTYFPLHYLAIIINSHVQTRFESLPILLLSSENLMCSQNFMCNKL